MLLADALDILARDIQSDDGVANAAIQEAAQRLRELRVMEDSALHGIGTLPNDGAKVLLLKRTGIETVMTSIGYKDTHGVIHGWIGKTSPTHWVKAPPATKRFS